MPNRLVDRPEVLSGRTIRLNSSCGAFYLTLNEHEEKLAEVRMLIGKSGNCQRNLFEVIALLLSVLLQSDIPKEKIVSILEHKLEVNCFNNPSYHEGIRYNSCIDFVVRKILEELVNRKEVALEDETTTHIS
jgi:ribonucleoside-diphosphate reductase alpha chain